jgi:hypothetical protein
MNTLLKEISSDLKLLHTEIVQIKHDIASIKFDMNIAKRNLEIVSDHTIKFDSHIDFIENKFNWYKGTLDFIQNIISLKFLRSNQHTFFFIE